MFKGSFVTMAEAIATHLSAGATRPGTWQRVADASRENGASAGRANPSMRARLTASGSVLAASSAILTSQVIDSPISSHDSLRFTGNMGERRWIEGIC